MRRQSTTEEILIARGFRRESTTEDILRCRNFRRQSVQYEPIVPRRGRRDSCTQITDGTVSSMVIESDKAICDAFVQTGIIPALLIPFERSNVMSTQSDDLYLFAFCFLLSIFSRKCERRWSSTKERYLTTYAIFEKILSAPFFFSCSRNPHAFIPFTFSLSYVC